MRCSYFYKKKSNFIGNKRVDAKMTSCRKMYDMATCSPIKKYSDVSLKKGLSVDEEKEFNFLPMKKVHGLQTKNIDY